MTTETLDREQTAQNVISTEEPFTFYDVVGKEIEQTKLVIDDRKQLIRALASCREANQSIKAIADARKRIIGHRDEQIKKLEREIIKHAERDEQLKSEIEKLHNLLNELETEDEQE